MKTEEEIGKLWKAKKCLDCETKLIKKFKGKIWECPKCKCVYG